MGEAATAQSVWRATVALLAAELAVEVGRTVVVEHSLGVDTIALVAMVGSLALSQELAGVVIGLMFSGGASLEVIASRRARRELIRMLVKRVEIDRDDVKIVFRVDPPPLPPDPRGAADGDILHHCGRRARAPSG